VLSDVNNINKIKYCVVVAWFRWTYFGISEGIAVKFRQMPLRNPKSASTLTNKSENNFIRTLSILKLNVIIVLNKVKIIFIAISNY